MIKTNISIFKDFFQVDKPFDRPVSYFLDRIKNGSAATEKIMLYRKTGDEKYKKTLPACTFTGTFSYRNSQSLVKFSQFACLDFDKFEDATDAIVIKNKLKTDKTLFAAFISPSGKGVKAVFRLVDRSHKYDALYRALCNKYSDVHLDSKTKDIARLCFESYDPDIYINENAEEWSECAEDDFNAIGTSSVSNVVPLKSENRIIDNLQTWFDKKYNMAAGDRNNSIYRFALALNSFGINQLTAKSYLSKYAQKGFSMREIDNAIDSAYKRFSSDFGTRVFEDNETKQIIQRAINSGKNVKEIKRDLEKDRNPIADNKHELDDVMENIRLNDDVSVFWEYGKNGNIRLIPNRFDRYLMHNNFLKFYPETSSDTFIFVRKDRNLIEVTTKDKIKDFVLNDLRSREGIGFTPFDHMANNTKYFKNEFLNMLDAVDIEIKKDTEDRCYLYFNNCVVEIGKDYCNQIDYLDIDKYVWKNTVINRDFNSTDHHRSEFRSFVWYIAGEDKESYNCFKSAIGYLMHSYKTSADNKAIILNDEVISDNPNGRSGKGVFFSGLKHLKKLVSINGKDFSFDKNFAFQTVSTDCQILVFDDVKKNFAFENLFSVITEGLTIEYKGQGAIKLPIEKSPKIVITTNYTIKGEGGSFDARKHELELSSYFNKDYSPVDQFGHRLFDQWSDKEWVRFDNFTIQCVQYYLKNGLKVQKHKNLELRKFIGETSSEFFEWASDTENLKINERITNQLAYNSFVDEYPDFRGKLQIKTFKKWMRLYADNNNLTYSDGQSNGSRYFFLSSGSVKDESDIMPF